MCPSTNPLGQVQLRCLENGQPNKLAPPPCYFGGGMVVGAFTGGVASGPLGELPTDGRGGVVRVEPKVG